MRYDSLTWLGNENTAPVATTKLGASSQLEAIVDLTSVWADLQPIVLSIVLLLLVAGLLRMLGQLVPMTSQSQTCSSQCATSTPRSHSVESSAGACSFVYACGILGTASAVEAFTVPAAVGCTQLGGPDACCFSSRAATASIGVGILLGSLSATKLLNNRMKPPSGLVGLGLLLVVAGNLLRILFITLAVHGRLPSCVLLIFSNAVLGWGTGLGAVSQELCLANSSGGKDEQLEKYVRGYLVSLCLGNILGTLLPAIAVRVPLYSSITPLAHSPALLASLLSILLAAQLFLGPFKTQGNSEQASSSNQRKRHHDPQAARSSSGAFAFLLAESFCCMSACSLFQCATFYVLGTGRFSWKPEDVSFFMVAACSGILPAFLLWEAQATSSVRKHRLRLSLCLQGLAVVPLCPWAQDEMIRLPWRWVCLGLLLADATLFSSLLMRQSITESMGLGNTCPSQVPSRAMLFSILRLSSQLAAPPTAQMVLDQLGENWLGSMHFIILGLSVVMVEMGVIPHINPLIKEPVQVHESDRLARQN